MDNQLKPCPFCGSDDTYTDSALGKRQVLCNACEAAGPTEETDDEAIASWNRLAARASDAAGAPVAWEVTPIGGVRCITVSESIAKRHNGRALVYADAAPVAPAAVAPKAEFEDPRVQAVYNILCGDDDPPLGGDHWEGWVSRRIVDTLCAPTTVAADAAAPINLEGLRKKLLTPRKILRDEDGYLSHPDFPICDEGTNAGKFLDAFGIDAEFVAMESDDPVAAERYFEAGEAHCSYWTPKPPEGDGWLLLEIFDTEDGPCALFGRDRYEAENALKRQRMHAQLDRFQQRKATQGDDK